VLRPFWVSVGCPKKQKKGSLALTRADRRYCQFVFQKQERCIKFIGWFDKEQSPHCSPPPSSSVTPSLPMANFEVDPTRWVPWGHQVIDGGPTRLPRSFYFTTQDPPQQHQSDCIGVVHPPPPTNLHVFWRHQVRNF
jgi:hypothetical protein